MKSASTNQNVSLTKKAAYLARLFAMRCAGFFHSREQIGPWKDLEEYEGLSNQYSAPTSLDRLRVVEIGYGQRPWRLVSLLAIGADAWGVDLERPMLGFSVRRIFETWRQNGVERALKSAVRSLLFDAQDLRKLRREIERRGHRFEFDQRRFLVGNAAEKLADLSGVPIDLVISEDVFEHIPEADIRSILSRLAGIVTSEGVLLIRPHIHTGIAGGHDPDFYAHRVISQVAMKEQAWSHLWDPGFQVNTYLNKLRLDDYRRLFSETFDILAEIPKNYGLGKSYLTAETRARIPAEISDEELMLNQVMFVLKRKMGKSGPERIS